MHQLIPINNVELFENSICDLFNSIENTSSYKRFGRNGHNQKGIDIFSTINDTAIQCKKKDLTRKYITLKKELHTRTSCIGTFVGAVVQLVYLACPYSGARP